MDSGARHSASAGTLRGVASQFLNCPISKNFLSLMSPRHVAIFGHVFLFPHGDYMAGFVKFWAWLRSNVRKSLLQP